MTDPRSPWIVEAGIPPKRGARAVWTRIGRSEAEPDEPAMRAYLKQQRGRQPMFGGAPELPAGIRATSADGLVEVVLMRAYFCRRTFLLTEKSESG